MKRKIKSNEPLYLRLTPFHGNEQLLDDVRIKCRARTTPDSPIQVAAVEQRDSGFFAHFTVEQLKTQREGIFEVEVEIWVPKEDVTKEQDMYTIVNDWAHVGTSIKQVGILTHAWNGTTW